MIFILDNKFKILEDLQRPKMVHFAGRDAKPWNNPNATLSLIYWKFLRQTFWYEIVIGLHQTKFPPVISENNSVKIDGKDYTELSEFIY